MKATITYCIDGTTQPLEVEGDRISTQMWRKHPRREGRKAQITVRNANGKRTKVVHVAFAYLIEVEYDTEAES